jgi:large subunit ribosomal protein L30
MATTEEMIRITMTGSLSGCTERQRATLRGLGLRRRGRTVIVRNTVPIRGMITKVAHLIKVEE